MEYIDYKECLTQSQLSEKDQEIQELRKELLVARWGFDQAVKLVANTISCYNCPCWNNCDKYRSIECLNKISMWCLSNGKS